MRIPTRWSIAVGVAVLALFVTVPFILRLAAGMQWLDILEYTPYFVIGLLQVGVSLVAVWYNLSRNPELRIVGPLVQPEKDGQIVADKRSVWPVRFGDEVVRAVVPDRAWKGLRRVWQVECHEMPSTLRFLFDIANIGLSGIMLHDYIYQRVDTKPPQVGYVVALFSESHGHLGSYRETDKNISHVEHPRRCYLEAKERTTEMFDFPWDDTQLTDGSYALGVFVRSGGSERPKARKVTRVWISSEDGKVRVVWT